MTPGFDPGTENVDISLVFNFCLRSEVFSMFLLISRFDFLFEYVKKYHLSVVILGGQNVDMSLVLHTVVKCRFLSQLFFFIIPLICLDEILNS